MSTRAARLHASPWQGVFNITGGGASLLTELLAEPGASKTLLDARIPYASAALSDVLGGAPDQACSAPAARAMAMAAMQQAIRLGSTRPFGLACTASIITDREKKGAHRAHAAVQTLDVTCAAHWQLSGKDRAAQEQELVEHLWQLLLRTVALDAGVRPADQAQCNAEPAWRQLLEGSIDASSDRDHDGRLLLPGAFNPLHDGHRAMLRIAEQRTGLAGAYELAIVNVDKPPLDYLTIEERMTQFDRPVWLTRLPTFAAKAARFPGAHFALGVDTLVRIAEQRYYASERAMHEALHALAELDTHFVVFGRELGGRFVVLSDLADALPQPLLERCIEISESEFRQTLSSSQLRGAVTPVVSD